MSDAQTKVTAMLAVKANTRLVLATELVARNEQLETARAAYLELRDAYRALHTAAAPAARPAPTPVVTRFTKADGTVWEKTRVGNVATTRQVVAA